MPIEFNCYACRQWLSTPDGSAGRQCQCPDCGTLLTIPSRSSVTPGNVGCLSNPPASTQHSASQSKVQQAVTEPSTDSLKIPCPRCRFELVCSPSLLGTKGQCRNCQHIFTIASSDNALPAASESDSPDLVFHCPSCAQLFAGQAEMEGKKGKCHACGEVFAIALEPAPVVSGGPSQRKTAEPKPKELKPAELGPASASTPTVKPSSTSVAISRAQRQAPIQFNCQYCAGVMEVPAATSGRQTLCPYCDEPLTIPATSGSPRSPTASLPVDSAGSHSATTAALATQSQKKVWTELSDNSSAVLGEPCVAPVLQPETASSGGGNAPSLRKQARGLTFSNAFQLAFSSLLPFCLIAPVLFGIATVITLITIPVLISFAEQTVQMLDMTDATSVQLTVLGLLAVAVLVGVIAATAAYCMTCNTALHAVRGKHISSRVVFSTGGAYGGMFAILLGWTILNLLLSTGVPLIMQQVAAAGSPQSAKLIGILIVGVFFLVQTVFTYLWSFVPFALLDGQSLPSAMGTSTSICLHHWFIVLPALICGWLLYILIGIASIGLGLVLMIGAQFYLN
ncbi:MAG: hypothetical protein KDA72_14135, partial [Planctomycetales bacterium]|nr:hypothetical protein [Planctomycetales bacterium]